MKKETIGKIYYFIIANKLLVTCLKTDCDTAN